MSVTHKQTSIKNKPKTVQELTEENKQLNEQILSLTEALVNLQFENDLNQLKQK